MNIDFAKNKIKSYISVAPICFYFSHRKANAFFAQVLKTNEPFVIIFDLITFVLLSLTYFLSITQIAQEFKLDIYLPKMKHDSILKTNSIIIFLVNKIYSESKQK